MVHATFGDLFDVPHEQQRVRQFGILKYMRASEIGLS